MSSVDPDDRGVCLALMSAPRSKPVVRCWGRMKAINPRLWVCQECCKRVDHPAPVDVMEFHLDRTPRSGADSKKR